METRLFGARLESAKREMCLHTYVRRVSSGEIPELIEGKLDANGRG
jgi:hypothetical protein